MALSPQLNLTQKQRLAMTPQLRQSIALMKLSNLELVEVLTKAAQENPLIDYSPPNLKAISGASIDAIGDAGGGMTADLILQIRTRGGLEARVCDAAELLIHELDERGYLAVPLFEVADRYGVEAGLIDEALAALQACNPHGIGARNLRECLSLQLEALGEDAAAFAPILDHPDLLAAPGRIAELAALLGVNVAEAERRRAVFLKLDPRPGARLHEVSAPPQIPELYVYGDAESGFRIELNSETLPSLAIREATAKELSQGGQEAKVFVQGLRQEANGLVAALAQRAKTMRAIGEALLQFQSAFFVEGLTGLRRLTMPMMAEALGVHHSTISRAISDRHLSCQHGIWPLRFFFTSGFADAEALTAPVIQYHMRQVLAQEPENKPFSDARLQSQLSEKGIIIARRTVAKYREAMGIPSSVVRRRGPSIRGL
ncbi:MAG: RNA polymerase factor sigma-54 [Pseudomonadota bacterium]